MKQTENEITTGGRAPNCLPITTVEEAAVYAIVHRSKEHQSYGELEAKLAKAASDHRRAAYLAKHGGHLATPSGPAPVKLQALSMNDVLQRIVVAPAAPAAVAPAPAPRRQPHP